MEKRLYRSFTEKMLGGVCGGLGEYFNIDPTIIRVAFILAVLFGGGGIIAYIILWIVVPQRPYIIPNFSSSGSSQSDKAEDGEKKTEDQMNFSKFQMEKSSDNKNLFFGLILIVLGALFLMHNFIPKFHFGDFWPLILIGIGIALILNGRKSEYVNEVKQ